MNDQGRFTVLVVDDVKENIRVLVEALKDDYSMAFALNGKAALSYVGKYKPDLVLLDIMMPEMDGFEVCRQLKKDPETREIPVLFLSALEDVKDKTVGFQAGGVDYITKPFHILEVKARVRTHLMLKNALEALRDQRDRMQVSLNLAMEVQQSLIPDKAPFIPGLEGAADIRYCDETGGDYYDWFLLKNTEAPCLGMAVGDVSEHGLPSALLMTTARALLRQRASAPGQVEEVVGDINQRFSEDVLDSGRFLSLFFAVFNPQNRLLTYVNAGHEPPLVVNPSGKSEWLTHPRGLPLGIDPRLPYQSGTVALKPGSFLVVYTDGLYEAMGEVNGKTAREWIQSNAVSNRDLSAHELLKVLMDPVVSENDCLLDDVTVLILKSIDC